MNEQQVLQIIRNYLQGTQYGTTPVPYHTHNGIDSPSIPSANGTPGGSNTQIQYNNSGSFGADSSFTWNKTTHTLIIGSEGMGNGGSVGGVDATTNNTGGGFLLFEAGNGLGDGDGGELDLYGGSGDVSGNGGNIVLSAGSKGASGGTNGKIQILSGYSSPSQSYTPSAAATATLDLSLANEHRITMPAGDVTIALLNDVDAQKFIISITQDSVGSRTVTWFSTILWAGGVVPTLTTTANKRDTLGFIRTGSGTYDGFVVGQNI